MCGVFAYLGQKNNAAEIILEGLKSLEYRGYDSWGIALKLKNNKIFIEKHTGKIGQAKLNKIYSYVGIGHTRWATHGGVSEKNAHPHTDCRNKIVVVHNGIVENFVEIKKYLLSKKHYFKSETDSEVIAHLLEEETKHKSLTKNIVLKVFNKLQGLNAIIIFHPKTNHFFAIKNGSPIVFGNNEKNKEFFIASDSSSLTNHTKQVHFLDDDELLVINDNGFKLFDKKGSPKSVKFLTIKKEGFSVDLGSYRNFMIKEINEQPKVLINIISNEKNNILSLSKIIKKAYGSYLIGCGTAYYACLAGSYMFSKIASRHINPCIGSEFSYLVDFLKETSLVIPLSQSGETIDIIASIKKAKEKRAKILAITNVLGSTLYRMADYKMLLNAGPEKCVLATKSFTAKIAILNLFAHAINEDYEAGVKQIKKAIKEVTKLLRLNTIKKIASELKNQNHLYILGRGLSYPTALESALKIKEVSYIHAEGFAAGELKHGVIALVEKGTPVIIFNPDDETYKDTLSSAYEVKARGACVIGISSKNSSAFDEFIPVDNCEEATIIPNVVIAQLMGYYLALAKGYDPDKPRNLAKSVTVK